MAHVVGVAHLAGSWPPAELSNVRNDGVTIGTNTFSYANSERSAMSSWTADAYLSSTPFSLLQPSSGCYVAENLRSWLVTNGIIDANAADTHLRQTTACGNDVGAPALVGENDPGTGWSTPARIEVGQPGLAADRAAIWPSVASSHASNNVLAAAAWFTHDNNVRVAYRGYNGAWAVAEPITALPTAGGSADVHVDMNKGGTAVVVTTPWYNAAVEVTFHGPAKDAEWTPLATVSTQPAPDQLKQYDDDTSHARVRIASTDVSLRRTCPTSADGGPRPLFHGACLRLRLRMLPSRTRANDTVHAPEYIYTLIHAEFVFAFTLKKGCVCCVASEAERCGSLDNYVQRETLRR